MYFRYGVITCHMNIRNMKIDINLLARKLIPQQTHFHSPRMRTQFYWKTEQFWKTEQKKRNIGFLMYFLTFLNIILYIFLILLIFDNILMTLNYLRLFEGILWIVLIIPKVIKETLQLKRDLENCKINYMVKV